MNKALFIVFLSMALAGKMSARTTFLENAKAGLGEKTTCFIENKGQVTDQNAQPRLDIQFKLAATAGLNIFIGNGAIHYQFSKDDGPAKKPKPGLKFPLDENINHSFTLYRMDVELLGANQHAQIITEEKQDYYENYYTPGVGETGATAHACKKITYKNIYPHIDWVLFLKGSKFMYDFVVHTGGKVSDIKIKYGGATSIGMDATGNLYAQTPQGTITENAPYTYQADGKPIASNFLLKGNILCYETYAYKGDLIIDPTLEWATYYGGTGDDEADGLATDAFNHLYMAGVTSSISGIATSGAYQTTYAGGVYDAFLVRFNNDGTQIWATYYGGSGDDQGYSLATDSSGDIYMAGQTNSSTGIATTGAFQVIYGGGAYDAFLAKFDSSGMRLWATYFGGTNTDQGFSVSISRSGMLYLTGPTLSTGLATSGAYQTINAGDYDAFLVKFNGAGARQWATYYGGSGDECGDYTTVSSTNLVYLSGITTSTSGIATTGSYQPVYGGGSDLGDAFLVQFDSTGGRIWATYYGGSGEDYGGSVITNGASQVYLAGYTGSTSGIASSGAYQATYGGGTKDALLVLFNSSGMRQWATYYGGPGDDWGFEAAIDSFGNVYMTGETSSTSGIATAGGYQTTYGGGRDDAYFVQFDSSGARHWATYYGDTGDEWSFPILFAGAGRVYIAGRTSSTSGIATIGASQTAYAGGPYDAFLALFDFTNSITGPVTLCNGNAITLSDVVAGGAWSSNNTSVAIIGSGTGIVTGVSAGTSVISYIASTDTITVVITVYSFLSAGVITGPDTICIASGVSLIDTAIGGIWSCTNGNASITDSGAITGINSGLDTVRYIVSNAGCIDSAAKVIDILYIPASVTIGGPEYICIGEVGDSLNGSPAGGSWSASNSSANINDSGIIIGVVPGLDTIYYSFSSYCNAGSAKYILVYTQNQCDSILRVAVNNARGDALLTYPNPNAGSFNVEMQSATNERVHITITDLIGRKIEEWDVKTNIAQEIKLDGPSGVYFIEANSQSRRYESKVVIER